MESEMNGSKQVFGEPEITAGAPKGIERLGYSIAEAAAILGLSPRSMRAAIKPEQMKVVRWGRRAICRSIPGITLASP